MAVNLNNNSSMELDFLGQNSSDQMMVDSSIIPDQIMYDLYSSEDILVKEIEENNWFYAGPKDDAAFLLKQKASSAFAILRMQNLQYKVIFTKEKENLKPRDLSQRIFSVRGDQIISNHKNYDSLYRFFKEMNLDPTCGIFALPKFTNSNTSSSLLKPMPIRKYS